MREKLGVRTHILLVVAMAVIIAVVTGLSLLLIRHHLRDQVTADLSSGSRSLSRLVPEPSGGAPENA